MAVPLNEIKQRYQANLGLYQKLMDEAIFEIKHALDGTEIKYHSVIARIKSLESLIGKVESGQIKDPFTETSYIVGTRIVALFLSDIDKILEILNETFDVSFIDNKIDDTDPRIFGYFSVHLDAKIKASYMGTRYDGIKHLPFEIQIRTIAMDAWASASHYLDYKSEDDVPADLKRDFNALSGLYYVADKHFEMFFRSRTANLKRINLAFEENNPPMHRSIDLDTLLAFLRDRFSDREQPDEASDASDLLSELRGKGITDLADLSQLINSTEKEFLIYEVAHPPGVEHGEIPRFTATGAVRGIIRGWPQTLENV